MKEGDKVRLTDSVRLASENGDIFTWLSKGATGTLQPTTYGASVCVVWDDPTMPVVCFKNTELLEVVE